MGKPFVKLVLGGLAGFVVWMIMEPSAPKSLQDSQWEVWSGQLVAWLGLAIGLVIGGYNGWLQGSKWHLIRGLLLGALLGWVGAIFGANLGDTLIRHTVGEGIFTTASIAKLPIIILARVVALTPVGTFLGAAVGASTLNWRRTIQGAIGGTIGAGIGGALFDTLGSVLAAIVMTARHVPLGQEGEVGIFSRALYCVLLGAGIGLFVGMVENVSKVAWIRLIVGRNEGREWVVDSAQTVIGRSETANVPLFGDSAIAPQHASITRNGPEYMLNDLGSPSGTYLNGQRITQSPLFHGAMIQVGGYRLEFLMKVGVAPQSAADLLRAQQYYPLQPQAPAAPYATPVASYGMPGVPAPAGYPQVPMQPVYPSNPTVQAPMPAQQATGGVDLVAVTGPLTGQRFPVGAMIEAGREVMGIPLAFDSSASRRHASFTPMPGGLILTDLGSTNGTFVNDQRVQAATLAKGDLVRIGVTTFRVE